MFNMDDKLNKLVLCRARNGAFLGVSSLYRRTWDLPLFFSGMWLTLKICKSYSAEIPLSVGEVAPLLHAIERTK